MNNSVQQRSVQELIDRNLQVHGRSLDEIINRFRNTVIVRALELHNGNISQTAELLRIHRNNLVRWMDIYGLRESESKKGEAEA